MTIDGMEPRLRIELVPRPLWRQSLRKILSDGEWDRLRQWALDRAGNTCVPCGRHVEGGKDLICYEQWAYDDQAATQTLTGVEIHCWDCDAVTHIGYAGFRGGGAAVVQALRRLVTVTGCTPQQAMNAYGEAMRLHERRSDREWTQDIGWYRRWLDGTRQGS